MIIKNIFTAIFFYIYYGLCFLVSLLPMRVQYLFSDLLFVFAFYFPGYRKKLVFENIRKAFPEKSGLWVRNTARSFYRHMCDTIIETFAMLNFRKKDIMTRYRYKNPEVLYRYFEEGRSVVAVFGHYGNWEWFAGFPLVTPFRVLALYKPLKNKHFDRMVTSLRQKFGVVTVPVKQSLRRLLYYRNKGEPTITLFLGDQRPGPDRLNHWTTFFGRNTPVFTGTEKVAVKLDQPVVFLDIQKIKRGYYEVEIIPLFEKPGLTRPGEITEGHTRILEKIIRKKPEYWLWSHNRWKYTKPDPE